MKLLTVSALALASAALLQTPVQAAGTVSAKAGDLILSFDVNSGTGTGATQDYEVDLGKYSTFATAGYVNANVTPLSADLSSLYGSGFAGRNDLEYSIAGANNSGNDEIYLGVQPIQGAPETTSSQSSGNQDILLLTGNLNGSASTANNPQATARFTNTTAGGFTTQFNGSAGYYNQFSAVYPAQPVTDTTGVPEATVTDLYDVPEGSNATPVLIGAFELSPTGVLSYENLETPAVPEPSAYALGICAVVLFWVLKRRHSVA